MELLQKLEAAPADASDEVRRFFLRLGRHGRQAYPFGKPISVERSHIPLIKSRPYWVCEKTDGLRVALVFLKNASAKPVAYMIDTIGKIYGLQVSAAAAYFEGSLFDGELVYRPDTRDYAVLVFDVACVHGDASIAAKPYADRRDIIRRVFPSACVSEDTARRSVLLEGFILSGRPGVNLLRKDMYTLDQAADLKAAVKTLPHASDGFILTPDDDSCPGPGTAWTTYKIKERHTIDLLWDGTELWYGNGAELFPISGLNLADIASGDAKLDKIVYTKGDLASFASGSILEMTPEILAGGFICLRLEKKRVDCEVPNNILCVSRTIKSVVDGISLDDFILASEPSP